MTRPDSNGSPDSSHPKSRPPAPPEADDRPLAATIGGAAAGLVAFAVLLLLGLLLYERLWGNSALALAVIGLLFGAAGLYAGWIAGVMVFSALRGERRG